MITVTGHLCADMIPYLHATFDEIARPGALGSIGPATWSLAGLDQSPSAVGWIYLCKIAGGLYGNTCWRINMPALRPSHHAPGAAHVKNRYGASQIHRHGLLSPGAGGPSSGRWAGRSATQGW